jgi:ketosteroid isomerase-like protein
MATHAELSMAMFHAYEKRDRAFVEQLLTPDFLFSSPYDDRIDRDTYFVRCWPNSGTIARFDFVAVHPQGEAVLIVYECTTRAGATFRNAEYHVFENGKLKSVEVFFGDPPAGVPKIEYSDFVEVGRQAWEQRLHSM